jgi:hypothetical protein
MNTDVAPGRVYLLKGRPVLVAGLQLTATGNGHGDMLLIATLTDGPTTWTEDITDVKLPPATEHEAVSIDGVAAISKIAKPTPPLNEPFWDAVRGANVATRDALGPYMEKFSPAEVEEWAVLLFDTVTDDDDLGFTDLANCTYSVRTKQLIMWWIRRTAMHRFRGVVPMGGGTIKEEAFVVQTKLGQPGYRQAAQYAPGVAWRSRGYPLVMAGRMWQATNANVPTTGHAEPNTQVFEKLYCGASAVGTFESFLVGESRPFGDPNLSNPCLSFLEPVDLTPWQIAQGYHLTFNADIWSSGGCLTPPNSPVVMTRDGMKASPEETNAHVAAVWPRMVQQICGELKVATMAKLAAIKQLESEWIKSARGALLGVMRAREEFNPLFRDPMNESNEFYPAALQTAVVEFNDAPMARKRPAEADLTKERAMPPHHPKSSVMLTTLHMRAEALKWFKRESAAGGVAEGWGLC